PAPRPEPLRETPRPASEDELALIATRIWATVDESALPVSAGMLALRLRQEHPDIMENWNGGGTFKAFFRSLGLSRLLWVSGSGGRILDPARHEVEAGAAEQDPESSWFGSAGTFAVVREVCSLTGAPMLAPQDLKLVIRTLSELLAERGFESGATAHQVCSRCLEAAGIRVRQRDVSFLVRGMQLNGHVFGQGNDSVPTLSSRLVNQVLFLCEREQKVLDGEEIARIREWVGAEG
ncbi:NYN domain-containing protein, partial [Rubrivivax gelatinosus]|nr:NYN domain-containing protein [Rubrivivax gelatinosus]